MRAAAAVFSPTSANFDQRRQRCSNYRLLPTESRPPQSHKGPKSRDFAASTNPDDPVGVRPRRLALTEPLKVRRSPGPSSLRTDVVATARTRLTSSSTFSTGFMRKAAFVACIFLLPETLCLSVSRSPGLDRDRVKAAAARLWTPAHDKRRRTRWLDRSRRRSVVPSAGSIDRRRRERDGGVLSRRRPQPAPHPGPLRRGCSRSLRPRSSPHAHWPHTLTPTPSTRTHRHVKQTMAATIRGDGGRAGVGSAAAAAAAADVRGWAEQGRAELGLGLGPAGGTTTPEPAVAATNNISSSSSSEGTGAAAACPAAPRRKSFAEVGA